MAHYPHFHYTALPCLLALLFASAAPAAESTPPPPAQRPAPAYLGIQTTPVPPLTARHLGLEEGMGLAIVLVLPDSPAAAAGVLDHDILLRLDDQILFNTDQLRSLVRTRSPGDSLRLELLREGRPLSLEATLSAAPRHPPPPRKRAPAAPPVPEVPGVPRPPAPPPPPLFEFNFDAERFREIMEDFRGQLRQLQESAPEMKEELGRQAREIADQVAEIVDRMRERGRHSTTIIRLGERQSVVRSDAGTIARHPLPEGGSFLTITDPEHNVVYAGPEADLDPATLPPALRELYEQSAKAERLPAPADPVPPEPARLLRPFSAPPEAGFSSPTLLHPGFGPWPALSALG